MLLDRRIVLTYLSLVLVPGLVPDASARPPVTLREAPVGKVIFSYVRLLFIAKLVGT